MTILYKAEYLRTGSYEWESHSGHLPLPIRDALDQAYVLIFHNPDIVRVRLINQAGEVKVEMGATD